MSVYKVLITNSKTCEILEVHEYICKFFSKEMTKNTLHAMFWFSRGGCEFDHLRAIVKRDDDIIFDLIAVTTVDGTRIFTDFYLQRGLEMPEHIRYMVGE